MLSADELRLQFPFERVEEAKRFLLALRPWWARYLNRFDVVPMDVPIYKEGARWAGTVSIPEGSLTMYVDVSFASRSSLEALSGSIEHELQRSRRRFDERRRALPDSREEFFLIASRMEIASSLRRDYERALARKTDGLEGLLAGNPVFSLEDAKRHGITGPPLSWENSWLPEHFDFPQGRSAEEYVALLVAKGEGDQSDSDGDGEEGQAEAGGGSAHSEEGGGPEPRAQEEQETQEGEGSQSPPEPSEVENEEGREKGTPVTEEESRQSALSGDEGSSTDSDSDDDSEAADDGLGGDSDEDMMELSGDTYQQDDEEGYEQLNIDNGDGSGRSGGWQGRGASQEEVDKSDWDAEAPEGLDTDQSTGIEESGQIASSQSRTDRRSDGSEGRISDDGEPDNFHDLLEELKAENPVMDWQSFEFNPALYQAEGTDEADPIEAIERRLEEGERAEADIELIEDVKAIERSSEGIPPSDEDVALADVELQYRGQHWTDELMELAGSAVQSAIMQGNDDYSYANRNPNQPEIGPIMMGPIGYSVTLYAVLDVSGSMLRHMQSALENLQEIMEMMYSTYQVKVKWFVASREIYDWGEGSEIDIDFRAAVAKMYGGVTTFGEDVAALASGMYSFDGEEFPTPDVLILLSDLMLEWPASMQAEPECRFISGIPAEHMSRLLGPVGERTRKHYNVPAWMLDPERVINIV